MSLKWNLIAHVVIGGALVLIIAALYTKYTTSAEVATTE